MKRRLILLLWVLMPVLVSAQGYNQVDVDGNVSRRGENFNPHNNDTTGSKQIPKGIYVWTVDPLFGDVQPTDVDTIPHLYPQSTMAAGINSQYQTIGSNYTARLNRIFTDRFDESQFLFTDAYSQIMRQPWQFHFTNTLSPITNLSYLSCGDKQTGEDLLDARFAVNAGKRTGMGFDLDYRYARGYYQNQSNSHFGATFYVSHLAERYQLHALFTTRHQKATENGGITNDNFITHPELYTESYSDNEIPTQLGSNWNRNDNQRLFLTHRYSVGFYRQVPMTPEEIEAYKKAEKERQQQAAQDGSGQGGRPDDAPVGRPDDAPIGGVVPAVPADSAGAIIAADSTRIQVSSKEQADSLIAAEQALAQDTASQYMKREFVPVTSFIHTVDASRHDRTYLAYASPKGYYADNFYVARPGGGYVADSIFDKTKYTNLRNTFAIAMLEGFNKYVPAGLKAFISHEFRRYELPDLIEGTDSAYLRRWTEHNVSIGGQLIRTQGSLLHYNLLAEAFLVGEDAGSLKLDAQGDLNIPLLGDTVRLDAKASLHRVNPLFLQRHYHSKHLWWDNDFDHETRTHIEGILTYPKTDTRLRVAVDNIQKYTYLGTNYNLAESNDDYLIQDFTAAYRQHDEAVNVLTAQLDQRLSLGPIHWDNIVTWQKCSDKEVLPLPELNVFSNLYLKFMVAHVLSVELGASATWFTEYDAPQFVPQLNQYAVQENPDSRVSIGNFPFVDVYANLHLKHARFFIMMNNVTANNFDRRAFLTPHYPLNRSVLYLGISWNFFN